jgi:hypothetical protein
MSVTLASSNVEFLSRHDGMQRISTSDEYSHHLTKFDRMAKIRTLDPSVDEGDYLQNCRQFVREWTEDEIAYLSGAIREVDQRMSDLGVCVTLPATISFVATTGWEEGGVRGYTRENTIYLNRHRLSRSLVFHELFHIISRYNEAKRDRSYHTLRFTKCNDLDYDEDLRITNPDAPSLCHFIRFLHSGLETFGAIIIRSSAQYTGGGFFSYVTKKLLVVEESAGWFSPKLNDGKLVFLDFSEVAQLYSKIGRNTAYNIHQEEICAEHFAAIMTEETELPDQHLVSNLLSVLQS